MTTTQSNKSNIGSVENCVRNPFFGLSERRSPLKNGAFPFLLESRKAIFQHAHINPDNAGKLKENEKPSVFRHQFNKIEKMILPIALIIGICFDRIVVENYLHFSQAWGGFWLVYLFFFYLINWQNAKHKLTGWIITAISVLQCILPFFGTDQLGIQYSEFSILVIPLTLMAHAQLVSGGFKLKQTGPMFVENIAGWTIRPFSAIPYFFHAATMMFGMKNRNPLKRAMLGILLGALVLCIVFPLLLNADEMFARHFDSFFSQNVSDIVMHLIVIIIATLLFYSFFWNHFNYKYSVNQSGGEKPKFDALVCGTVLVVLLLVYVLFGAVQFKYLFAGGGLPDDLTFSQYAVQGFSQLIMVTGINLILFGIILEFSKEAKAVKALLCLLLLSNVMMIVSAFLRLSLYIGAYGLTWLRLLSMWFIVFLAVTVILSGIRMLKPRLPLISIAVIFLLAWFCILGYANPERMVSGYNFANNKEISYSIDNNY